MWMKNMNETIFFNSPEYEYGNSTNSSSDSIVSDRPHSVYVGDHTYFYGGEYFESFKKWYRPIHGYLSIVLCCFGLLTNVLNIIVLTRKNMITPTNTILTGLAATDMGTMASYLLFAISFYLIPISNIADYSQDTYHSSVTILFHAHFSVICHTISIWLTVTLAVFRYIAVSVPSKNKRWCNMRRAKIAIISAYLTTVIICIPNYLSVTFRKSSLNSNETIYIVVASDIALANDRLLLNVNFWIFSVLTKLIPCVALTILSILLMRALYHANQRKRKLSSRMGREEAERSCDRTTRMLLSVLLLFLITEFPLGMIALLSGILGPLFFINVYQPLGDLMDILALINSGVNFVLYCTMSRQFRETFKLMFTPEVLNKWSQLQASSRETETTCV